MNSIMSSDIPQHQYQFLTSRLYAFVSTSPIFGVASVGKDVHFTQLPETSPSREISFITSLEESEPCGPTYADIDRYVITLDRFNGNITKCKQIKLGLDDLSLAVMHDFTPLPSNTRKRDSKEKRSLRGKEKELEAKQQQLPPPSRPRTKCRRVPDSKYVSYKVEVAEGEQKRSYVVQIRPVDGIERMHKIMAYLRGKIHQDTLPIPMVIQTRFRVGSDDKGNWGIMSGTGEGLDIKLCAGMALHITSYLEGYNARNIYMELDHNGKMAFAVNFGKAMAVLWNIKLRHDRTKGVTGALEVHTWNTSRRRKSSFGGSGTGKKSASGPESSGNEKDRSTVIVNPLPQDSPLHSMVDFLASHITSGLSTLRQRPEKDEFRKKYLRRLEKFICAGGLARIPDIVENVPTVFVNRNMRLDNLLVEKWNIRLLASVTDWSCCEARPFPEHIYQIEDELISPLPPNYSDGKGGNRQGILDALWGAIPDWKDQRHSEATKTFLKWYRFGCWMATKPPPMDMPRSRHRQWWAESARGIEDFLKQYE